MYLQDFGNRQLITCKHHPKALRLKSKQKSNIQLLLRASLVWKWAGNVRKPVLPTRCPVLPSSSQVGSSFAHGALLGFASPQQTRNHKTLTVLNSATSWTLAGIWDRFEMQQDIPPAPSLPASRAAAIHPGLCCRLPVKRQPRNRGTITRPLVGNDQVHIRIATRIFCS